MFLSRVAVFFAHLKDSILFILVALRSSNVSSITPQGFFLELLYLVYILLEFIKCLIFQCFSPFLCFFLTVCTRKTRILDVIYNASNNELVRTKTLVKNAIVVVSGTLPRSPVCCIPHV